MKRTDDSIEKAIKKRVEEVTQRTLAKLRGALTEVVDEFTGDFPDGETSQLIREIVELQEERIMKRTIENVIRRGE